MEIYKNTYLKRRGNMKHLSSFFTIDDQMKQQITDRVIEELFLYAKEYLPKGVVYGLVVAVTYYILCTVTYLLWSRLVRKDKPSVREWASRYLGSSFFLCVLVAYVYVSIGISVLCREPGSRQSLNLTLFSTFNSNLQERIYVVENLLMFIPLGILLPLVWKALYRFPWCVMIGMVGSIAIEVVQYRLARGYSQIDDVMNNTIGTLLGYWIVLVFHGCMMLWRRWRRRVREKEEAKL